jgi:hypothetical protein
MALNFPPLTSGGAVPSVGQQFYDAAADTTWEVIDRFNDGAALIPVWQIISTGANSTFGGAIDITVAPPNPLPAAGVYYAVSDPGGTVHVGFGNLGGATFTGGEQVIYTGDSSDPWIQIGGSLPESTTSTKGIVQLATAVDVSAGNSDKAVTVTALDAGGSDGGAYYVKRSGDSVLGSLGIGLASNIGSKLHVKDGTVSGKKTVLTLEAAGTAADDGPAIDFIPNGSSLVSASIVGARSGSTGSGGHLSFYTNNGLLNDERLRIGRTGTVEILKGSYGGTAVVNAVANALSVSASDSNGISILTPNNTYGSLFFGDGDDNFVGGLRYNHVTDDLGIYANNAERLRIDNSGNLKVGGTLPSSPNITLAADGSSDFADSVVVGPFNTSSDNATGIRLLKGNSASNVVIQATNGVDGSTSTALAVYKGQSSVTAIKYDGSAEFDNNLTLNGSTQSTATVQARRFATASLGSNAEGRFVQNTGFAALSLGSDNTATGSSRVGLDIQYDGSSVATVKYDGSATFDGDVAIGTTEPASDAQLTIGNNGDAALFFRRYGTNQHDGAIVFSGGDFRFKNGLDSATAAGLSEQMRLDAAGNLKIGGTLPSSPNISLNADGTAGFASSVTTNRSSDGYAFRLEYNSVLRGGLFVSSTGSSLALKDSSSSNNNVLLDGADGSAQFIGSVSIGGTAAANTIDEYEEGTFTPDVSVGGVALSIATSTGSYTRIGNVCQVTLSVTITSSEASGQTGNLAITGLPFASPNTTSSNYSTAIAGLNNWSVDFRNGDKSMVAFNAANSTTLALYSGSRNSRITDADFDFGPGSNVAYLTFTYRIA